MDFPQKEKGCFSAEKLKTKLSIHDLKWAGIKSKRKLSNKCRQHYLYKVPLSTLLPTTPTYLVNTVYTDLVGITLRVISS